MAAAAHTHAARKESTQRPNATASRTWICLLQISRDILAIIVTERWEDGFGWACVEEEGGDVFALRAHVGVNACASTPLRCTEQLHILIKVLFGLSCWHEPSIICCWVSLLTWMIHLTPIFYQSTCGVWSADWAVGCQLSSTFNFSCINFSINTLVRNDPSPNIVICFLKEVQKS